MDKLTSLQQSYDTLLQAGRISNKKEFAALLGREYTGIINAFAGNEKFLTRSLVARAMAAANEIPDSDGAGYRVPLLPVEAHGGSLIDFEDGVNGYECEMVVSPVRGASFAIQVTGESMSPAFPNGCKILIQRVNEAAFIEWGRVYVLDTVNGIIVKQVRQCEDPACVLCCSLNPAPEYAPFKVETKYIRGWFRVLMKMALV